MFTREQSHIDQGGKKTKKAVFGIGTPFVKPKGVKRSFTYKEFSLIAGIAVALIIVFTLWLRSDISPEAAKSSGKEKSTVSLPQSAKSFVRKAFAQIRF